MRSCLDGLGRTLELKEGSQHHLSFANAASREAWPYEVQTGPTVDQVDMLIEKWVRFLGQLTGQRGVNQELRGFKNGFSSTAGCLIVSK